MTSALQERTMCTLIRNALTLRSNKLKPLLFTVSIDARSYCKDEWFEPTCDAGHVVVMTYARFGRMQLGRCAKTNMGDIGCGVDVLRKGIIHTSL